MTVHARFPTGSARAVIAHMTTAYLGVVPAALVAAVAVSWAAACAQV
jgi:hypothetical protein